MRFLLNWRFRQTPVMHGDCCRCQQRQRIDPGKCAQLLTVPGCSDADDTLTSGGTAPSSMLSVLRRTDDCDRSGRRRRDAAEQIDRRAVSGNYYGHYNWAAQVALYSR